MWKRWRDRGRLGYRATLLGLTVCTIVREQLEGQLLFISLTIDAVAARVVPTLNGIDPLPVGILDPDRSPQCWLRLTRRRVNAI